MELFKLLLYSEISFIERGKSIMLENPLHIVGLIVLGIVLVFLILKSISIIVKLLILCAVIGIMYVLYGIYPTEVIIAGGVIVALLVLLHFIKNLFKKK